MSKWKLASDPPQDEREVLCRCGEDYKVCVFDMTYKVWVEVGSGDQVKVSEWCEVDG
jgi:hypothetical protein